MKGKNTTDAPQWAFNQKSAFLAALHVLVLAVSLADHRPLDTGGARPLP